MSGRWIVLAVCVTAEAAWAGYGEDLQAVQFTPFYGYRFSGGLEGENEDDQYEIDDAACWGGMLDFRLSDVTQLEFYFSRQETEVQAENGLFDGQTLFDMDVDYYHIGGTYILIEGPWQPFAVGTLGATRLDPDAPGGDSMTRFSIGLGGGLRYFPVENFGLYVAARGVFTFVEGETLFRSQGGEATVRVDSDGLWQAEVQAGIAFAF